MSEPTYRVELRHTPEDADWPWSASVVRIADELPLFVRCGSSREQAFERAKEAVRRASAQEPPSDVYLTEDGEIHDRFDLHSVKA